MLVLVRGIMAASAPASSGDFVRQILIDRKRSESGNLGHVRQGTVFLPTPMLLAMAPMVWSLEQTNSCKRHPRKSGSPAPIGKGRVIPLICG